MPNRVNLTSITGTRYSRLPKARPSTGTSGVGPIVSTSLWMIFMGRPSKNAMRSLSTGFRTLSSVFARYDENYEFQALALGASPVRTFFIVTLPLVAPGVTVAFLFAFLISWSQYLLTLLIGSGQIITLPILLFSAASGGNPISIATLSLLFVTPPVLVIAMTTRYLNQHGDEFREQY